MGVGAFPLKTDGAPDLALGNDVNFAGSNTGLYFDMDRVTPVQGRMANPARVDEFMTTALGAKLMGVRLGQVVPWASTPRNNSTSQASVHPECRRPGAST